LPRCKNSGGGGGGGGESAGEGSTNHGTTVAGRAAMKEPHDESMVAVADEEENGLDCVFCWLVGPCQRKPVFSGIIGLDR
jgi:hypothetical protein